MDIAKKNIVITGGAKGIGKELAIYLIGNEANVVIIDNDSDALQSFVKEYPSIEVFNCDISNYEKVKQVFDTIISKVGTVDVLLNNAAYIYNSPLINIMGGFKPHCVDQWHKVINTDLNAVFYTSSIVVENMVKQRTKGLILNVSSICAAGNPGQGAYAAAKAGVEAATKAWAKELGAFGIRFAGIAPGYVSTDTTMNAISETVAKDIKNKTPLRRFSETEEIVKGIIFIIENDFFNGKILQLDGGLVI